MNNKPDPVSPSFIRVLTTSLSYWQRLTDDLDDAGIIQIDPDWRNLYQAIDMGLELPQTYVLATTVALQSFFLAERRGYWEDWGKLYERALHLGEALGLHQRRELLHRLGELYRHAGQLTEAITVHKEAEALAQAVGDDLALAEARYRLAWDYLWTRQYEEAEMCCRFAIDTFTQLEKRADLLTNSYWAWGSLARRHGELDEAQERLSRALDMARTTQQPTHWARIAEELGITLSTKELYEEALAYYDKAAEILSNTNSERDKVRIQLNRAVDYYRQQRWLEAEMAWRQIINSAYLRQSGEIEFQARLAHNLGSVLLKRGDLEEAEAQINYALQLRLELQDDIAVANTTGSLGQVRARQGQREEALSLFRQARQLLTTYPDDAYAQRVLRIIKDEMRVLEG